MVSDFTKKRNKEGFKTSFMFQIGCVLFVAIIVFLFIINLRMYEKRKKLASQVNFYESQIENIEKDIQNIKKDIDNADDIDYLEKIAYEQLGKQKPGEQSIIFITPEQEEKEINEQHNFLMPAWLSNAWSWIKSKF
jgi:cell division protein FtsB